MSNISESKSSKVITEAIRGLFTIAAVLAIAAPFAYKFSRSIPPQVATVDIQSVLETEQKKWADGLSIDSTRTESEKKELESRSIRFAMNLSQTVEQLGRDCRCIVLNKAAVLSGDYLDLTDVLKNRMENQQK